MQKCCIPRGAGAPGTGCQHAAAALWTRVCAEPPSLAGLPEKGDGIGGDPATPPAASSHRQRSRRQPHTLTLNLSPLFSLHGTAVSGALPRALRFPSSPRSPEGSRPAPAPAASRTPGQRLPPAPPSRYAGPRRLSCPPHPAALAEAGAHLDHVQIRRLLREGDPRGSKLGAGALEVAGSGAAGGRLRRPPCPPLHPGTRGARVPPDPSP